MSEVFDHTPCSLGEGPLWHPLREQLYWFDINKHQLLTREAGKTRVVQFEEHVSAAGWVDDASLLIASETRLFLFDLDRERSEDVEGLEADDRRTRSNDGRADPWGGFWIGTMAKDAAPNAGAIYRFYDGKLTCLYPDITISNAICFSPDRKYAFFTDTPKRQIMRQTLKPQDGFPDGDPEVWLDLNDEGLNPDGAVIDAAGNLWNAQYGAWQVAAYAPDGTFLRSVSLGASQATCPAFGGPDLSTLFCTSAAQNIGDAAREKSTKHGMTFQIPEIGKGQAEHRVTL